jgi:hypothetical protein
MAEQWIIRVQGKDYGPADLETLREWKVDGRVIPTNPARRADVGSTAGASASEALWETAGEIPGLFQDEAPPVQIETGDQESEVSDRTTSTRPPTRNVFVETFRIYFRGFFQFLGLVLLSIAPLLCSELTSRFINSAPGINADLRMEVVSAFRFCMQALWIVLIPVYIAGIQILTAELATKHRISLLSVLNGAVKYWPRVAGLCIFVYGVFFLLILMAFFIAAMVGVAGAFGSTAQIVIIVIALGLLVLQVSLFCRFFVFTLFWQQYAVLEDLNSFDALRESGRLARSGGDLPWYQRPIWRAALIVSIWIAFALAIATLALWPKLVAQWSFIQDTVKQLSAAQDPQAVSQKIMESLPKEQPATWSEVGLGVLQRFLQPLLGIAFVVLYLDYKKDGEG